MKLGLLLILTALCHPLYAYDVDTINYAIEEVFVVNEGYDTNDNIEFTFTTKLPNACFTPYQSKIVKQGASDFRVSFIIKRKNVTACDDISSDQYKNPIYYTETLSIGELPEGNYNVHFSQGKSLQSKSFKVSKALTTHMDDSIYAPVTNLFIPDLVYVTNDAQVILSGILQDSCLQIFDRDIDVKKYDNTFVIIPKAIIDPQIDCQKVERPLQKIVSLGSIKKEGTYFIHVRSQSGLSVNKVFRVKEKEFNQSGRASH